MKETQKNLDYDKLLDDWSEELFSLADKHAKQRDASDIHTQQYGYHRGMHDAYIMAITKLNFLETRKSAKYEIE